LHSLENSLWKKLLQDRQHDGDNDDDYDNYDYDESEISCTRQVKPDSVQKGWK